MSTDAHRQTWERYVSAWKATSAEEKRALYASCLSPSCIYTDPLTIARGWDELLAYMVDFHRQIPGCHFVTDVFHTHHGRSVARWRMMTGEGTAMGDGVSYAEYADDGRLVTMTGFFETPAQAE